MSRASSSQSHLCTRRAAAPPRRRAAPGADPAAPRRRRPRTRAPRSKARWTRPRVRGASREERAGQRETPRGGREHVGVVCIHPPRPGEHGLDVPRRAERVGRRPQTFAEERVAEPPVRVPLQALGPGAGVLRERRRVVAVERRVRVVVRLVERLGRVREAAARPDARHEPRREVARPLEQRGPPVREPPRAAAREHERRPRRAAGAGRGGVRSDAALGDLGEDSGVPGPRAAARRRGVDAGQARREPSPARVAAGPRSPSTSAPARAPPPAPRARRRRRGARAGCGRGLEDLARGARRPRVPDAAAAPTERARRRRRRRAATRPAARRAAAPQARARLEPARRARDGLDRVAGLGRRVQGRRRHVRPARRAVAAAVGHPSRAPSSTRCRRVGRAPARRRGPWASAAAASARAHCDRAASHSSARRIRKAPSPSARAAARLARRREEGRGREDRDVGAARSARAREQVQEVRRRRAVVGLECARI